MGMLIDGRWTQEDRIISKGAFVRQAGAHDEPLSPGLIEAMAAEPGRCYLIASLSCPWSHRTVIVRQLRGIAETVPLQVAGGTRIEGYPVNGGAPWRVPGTDRQIVHLHQLYTLSDSEYSGRVTVPVLWDSRTRRILSNESARIFRALDMMPPPAGEPDVTLMPPDLEAEIDCLRAHIHNELCEAVYRAGLAQQQAAYDEAVDQVFAMLDALEDRLSQRRYLFGAVITEADWWLFPTLVRFDAVYQTHFRCTRRRLVDYPHLWAYARDLRAWHGVAETVDLAAIREGYYRNDGVHNPFGIVAAVPDADWSEPHGRAALGSAQVALRDGTTMEIDPTTLRPPEH